MTNDFDEYVVARQRALVGFAYLLTADHHARWSSCSWVPVRFSPDGSTVYADPINARGADANRHAVLDAETGDVLLVLSVAGQAGYLDSAVFEDDEALLVSVDRFPPRGPAVNAIVRCAVSSGHCETATPPQRVISGEDYVFDDGAAPSEPSYE